MNTATRRLQFSAGHRVHNHESKCANLHGHNYVVFLTAKCNNANGLDSLGRVIDFSVLKERFGDWIDRFWDHGMILYAQDPVHRIYSQELMNRQKLFLAPFNPTAEQMAEHLLREVGPIVLKDLDVTLIHVKLYETENCYAEATLKY